MVAYLLRRHYAPAGRPLRSCHPRDLLDQVTALCRYRGIEPVITRDLLDAACASYFVDEEPRSAPLVVPGELEADGTELGADGAAAALGIETQAGAASAPQRAEIR